MFVAYVSPQEQRNLAEHTHRYGCTHRRGPAFRVMSSYYFLAGVCFWGMRGQESHFCKGRGPYWGFLCPKPPPCITPRCTLFICLSELTHRASSLPPPSGLPGQEVQPQQQGLRWASSMARKARGGRWCLGATSRSFFYFIFWFRTPLGFFVSNALISLRVSWRIPWFTVLAC